MTIASEITRINGNIAAAYTAANNKGATMPATQNSANLATCIGTINTGITPSGTISITANGTYDVTNYASASVSVSGGYSELPSYQVVNGVASRRSGVLTGNEFSGITSVGNYGLQNAFYNCDALTGVLDLSAITSVGTYGLQSAFSSCDGITSANLSSLTSVGYNGLRNVFTNDGGLRSVDLSSLTSVDDYGLYGFVNGCFALRSVDLASLTSIGTYGLQTAFSSCRALTDVYFRSLTTSSFANVNAFTNMMQSTGTTTTHTLHFPSNLQSTISGLSGYPLFGGTSGYVVCAFDLTATS